MWEIVKYRPANKEEWDSFVNSSPNSTFLFRRDYMDYHSCRFDDFSLMAYRNGTLHAVLPANIADNILFSHQGLTYGGWVLSSHPLDTSEIVALWKAWLKFCLNQKIDSVIYKPLPYIYFTRPTQEELYLLFLTKANLISTNIASVIDISHNPGFNKLQKRHLTHTPLDCNTSIISASDTQKISEFYEMLEQRLTSRFGTKPVHSLYELLDLMQKLPDNIKIHGVFKEGEWQGGICIYNSDMVAHCQYIATTENGRENNVLAYLFSEAVKHAEATGKRYFDFGTSNEEGGLFLNSGLNRQKTAMGGSGVAYQTWQINVASASDLLKILPLQKL